MHGRIDFLAQDLLGTDNGQFSDALTQLLLGTFDFLFDFGFGTGNHLVSFDLGSALGFFDDLLRTLFSLSDEIRGFFLGFTQRFCSTFGSKLLLMLTTF